MIRLATKLSESIPRVTPAPLMPFGVSSARFPQCVSCNAVPPSCDQCPLGYVCLLTAQTCNSCPEVSCVLPEPTHSAFYGSIVSPRTQTVYATSIVPRMNYSTSQAPSSSPTRTSSHLPVTSSSGALGSLSDSTQTASPDNAHSTNSFAPILGGIIGGVLVAFISIILVFLIIRRTCFKPRAKRSDLEKAHFHTQAPFTLPLAPTSGSENNDNPTKLESEGLHRDPSIDGPPGTRYEDTKRGDNQQLQSLSTPVSGVDRQKFPEYILKEQGIPEIAPLTIRSHPEKVNRPDAIDHGKQQEHSTKSSSFKGPTGNIRFSTMGTIGSSIYPDDKQLSLQTPSQLQSSVGRESMHFDDPRAAKGTPIPKPLITEGSKNAGGKPFISRPLPVGSVVVPKHLSTPEGLPSSHNEAENRRLTIAVPGITDVQPSLPDDLEASKSSDDDLALKASVKTPEKKKFRLSRMSWSSINLFKAFSSTSPGGAKQDTEESGDTTANVSSFALTSPSSVPPDEELGTGEIDIPPTAPQLPQLHFPASTHSLALSQLGLKSSSALNLGSSGHQSQKNSSPDHEGTKKGKGRRRKGKEKMKNTELPVSTSDPQRSGDSYIPIGYIPQGDDQNSSPRQGSLLSLESGSRIASSTETFPLPSKSTETEKQTPSIKTGIGEASPIIRQSSETLTSRSPPYTPTYWSHYVDDKETLYTFKKRRTSDKNRQSLNSKEGESPVIQTAPRESEGSRYTEISDMASTSQILGSGTSSTIKQSERGISARYSEGSRRRISALPLPPEPRDIEHRYSGGRVTPVRRRRSQASLDGKYVDLQQGIRQESSRIPPVPAVHSGSLTSEYSHWDASNLMLSPAGESQYHYRQQLANMPRQLNPKLQQLRALSMPEQESYQTQFSTNSRQNLSSSVTSYSPYNR
uniref:ARAD1D03586p n=1 Tax=Blastobotrys adeninivorans TaxID=409370 RepID=A0A060T7J3_BLAAD